MTTVLVIVIVVLLVLLGSGFVVAARRMPLGRASRRPPVGPGADGETTRRRPGGTTAPGSRPAGAPPSTRPRAAPGVPEADTTALRPPRPAAVEPEPAPEPEPEPERARGALEALPGRPAGPDEAVLDEAVSDEAVGELQLVEAEELEAEAPAPVAPPNFRERLARTRTALASSLGGLRGRKRLDERSLDELEEALILADVGLSTTTLLLDDLRARVRSGQTAEGGDLAAELKAAVAELFDGEDRSLHLAPDVTNVWLFVGVNGVGKTTTIGKLAARETAAGRRVVLGAGDTFRAAAGDQLELWAKRSGASIVRGADGADPSSVIFDAVQHAARGAELVLADSAGRLHTKVNLMEELRKVRRIADRPPGRVTEVLLVLDATTGQNGLIQARQFTEAVGVTGVVLTKLDGTAKGGVVIAIRSELGLPIKLVGLGEGLQDLIEFDPAEFAEALFG